MFTMLEHGWASITYLILSFIIYKGLWQLFMQKRKGIKPNSLLSLGSMGLVFSLIAYVDNVKVTFLKIVVGGETPAQIASDFASSHQYPIIGLLCLGSAYFFNYLNQV
jgi:uncharacterized membrane protein HdeD (DUF308 family)